ncbi:MAG: aromatic ring-hydroxylating dioxygenase subunit alpha [Myxococcales bacterium]|nr:aromatic ring-hydroxylating dioxygenase subunit alpha [Myxococcales bacterium]
MSNGEVRADERGEDEHAKQDDGSAKRSLPIAGATRGHVSAARALDHWYVLANSDELAKGAVIARTLYDTPIVLFRGRDGAVGALLDRCPHRNVALSLGSVAPDDTLQCPYHGWRFDKGGRCAHIPSLGPEGFAKDSAAWRALAFAVRERDGFVWVYARQGEEPTHEPIAFAHFSDARYAHVYQRTEAEGTLHATAENALDVPHTAFLHKGLFRSESRGITIEAIVRASSDRVEAEYVGEPRPPGLVARVLSPGSAGTVEHYDRFIAPCIAQVEYRLGGENHVLVTTALTPVSDFRTKLFSVVSLRLRIPIKALAPVLEPLGLKIFQQDAVMLRAQTEAIKRFGGEQFASTEIDVLGRHIWRLLRACERGSVERDQPLREVSRAKLIV